jgi:hypothetical protein
MKSAVQKIVNSIRARPLQRGLFKSLSNETDEHYGNLILHTEIRWLRRIIFLFRFQELLLEIAQFFQDRSNLP